MIVAMPHCGLAANSTSGGEVVEREVLARIGVYGIDAHVLRPVCRGLRWWNSPALFEAPLRDCLINHAPALIRIHSPRSTGLAALAARWLTGVPITAHVHHLDSDRLAWLDRLVLRHADHVTTASEFSRQQIAALGVAAQVVRLGVDHQRFQPSPMPAGRVILLAGGTKARKNAAFVRRLWPELRRRVPEATLLQVGQGCRVDDAVMPGAYRAARAVAVPSLLEGFGLPVLEAMACGRPVVMSDRGALPEFGIPATPLEADAWIDRLAALLTDDGRWHAEATRNTALAQAYSWEATARAWATQWQA